MDEKLKEQYIQGKLSDTERIAFEKIMADDPALAKEVAFEIGLKTGIEKQSSETTKEFLKSIEAEHSARANYSWWWYAAAGVVLLAASYFTLMNPSRDQLFDQYYAAPQQFIVNVERGETTALTEKEKAFWHYDHKEYQAAKESLSKLLQAEENADYHFYLGICYVELDLPQQALEQWTFINDPKWDDDVKWYSAMTYLRLKDHEKVINLLNELVAGSDDYRKEATLLLEDLK